MKLTGRGGTDGRQTTPGCWLPGNRPALLHVREILADGLSRRATAIMLDYGHRAWPCGS